MGKVVRRQFNLCTRRCCFFLLPEQDVSRNFNFLHGFIARFVAADWLSFADVAFFFSYIFFRAPHRWRREGGGLIH